MNLKPVVTYTHIVTTYMNLELVITYTHIVRTYMNLEPVVTYTYIVRTYMNLEPFLSHAYYKCPDKLLRLSMYRCMLNNRDACCPGSKDSGLKGGPNTT